MSDQNHTPKPQPEPTQQPQAQPEPAHAAAQPQQQAQTQQQAQPQPVQQGPADTLRDGNLKATIWERKGESGPFHATTLARTYRDEGGEYRDSHSFSGTDLLRVSELAKDAYHRTNELRREQSQDRDAPPQHDQDQTRAERQAQHRQERTQQPAQPRDRDR